MHKVLPLLAVAIVLAASCAGNVEPASNPVPSKPESQDKAETAFVPGTIIVQLDEGQTDVMSALSGIGALSAERLIPDGGKWDERHHKAGLDRWYRVIYDPSTRPATKAAADFSSIPGVAYAEPERRIESASYFNDPSAFNQWGLFNDGTKGTNYLAGCDVNVEPVWDMYTAGTPNVIVSVVDEGVQFSHPDLAACTIPGGEDGSKCFLYDYEGYEIFPGNHGTHVAGIIAAVNNNGIGISGVAGGYDGTGGVKIMSCQTMREDPLDPNKTLQGDAFKALVWAADHGSVISNNSWSYVYDTEEDALAGDVGFLKDAIDYFVQYAGCDENGDQLPDSPMKGGVVFFSAGNNTWSIKWPSAYENVIAVGATNAKYGRASYSNYGDWVDICAPGGEAGDGAQILSSVVDGYDKYQGTSMSCPFVSGVAALIVSHFGGPGFTNEMLLEKLIGGARKGVIKDPVNIGPLVDALGAFTYGGTTPPNTPDDVTLSASSNTLTVSWTVTADVDDIKTFSYLVLAAKNASELAGVDPDNIPETVVSSLVKVGFKAVGDPISVELPGLEFETDYYVTVIACDYAGNRADASAVKQLQTGKNDPPVVSTEYAGSFSLQPYEKLAVAYAVKDPNGHEFTVDVDPGSDALSWKLNADKDTVLVTIAGNGAPAGQYTAHLVATDAFGAATDYPIAYEILLNHAPVVVMPMENVQFSKSGQKTVIDMSKYVSDEDGEQLTYSTKLSEKSVANISQSGNTLVVTSLGNGLTDVAVTASDACGEKCNLSFKILVRSSTEVADVYPNPVVDVLNIRPAAEGKLDINVYNKAGSVVWSASQTDASPFSPVTVDLSGMPGGIYYVKVQGAGIDKIYTIAKR